MIVGASGAAARHRIDGARVAAGVIAFLGSAVYAALLMRSAGHVPAAFGTDIYDQYWLALRNGQFDLPARVLRLEGHYFPDGTAFPYHGLAPLLTRIVADPFVSIGAVPLAQASIWFWATLGSAAWHAAVLRVGGARAASAGLLLLLGVLLWFGGPGVLLASNDAFYHEPIAMAFATTGAFALVWTSAVLRGGFGALDLVILAALAAVTLHARPNLALGLYPAVCAACVLAVVRHGRGALGAAAGALAILATGGALYLAANAAKFGDAGSVHGSFAPGPLQYGVAYWEMEVPNNPRQLAYEVHGRFNIGRILPNGALYVAAPPALLAPEANALVRDLHGAYTLPRTGYGRIEAPSGGILFLWTAWAILACLGLGAMLRLGPAYAVLVGCSAVGACVTLAFPAVTLRYVVDLWPLVATLAILGLAAQSERGFSRARRAGLGLAAGAGLAMSMVTASFYIHLFRVHPGTPFAEWTAERDDLLLAAHDAGQNRPCRR
jgi:hypothetical protein